jgi:peptidoglycan/LPS O-acetylase OafA/YrhL
MIYFVVVVAVATQNFSKITKICYICQDIKREKKVLTLHKIEIANTMRQERIQWLALLRGLNIILVVMLHVQLIDMATGLNHTFCSRITEPLTPIRMPLFIFLSGGLLYLSRIRKNWALKALYVDKVQRILVPFVFFVTLYFLIKALLNSLVKTHVDISLKSFLESFVFYQGYPSAPLWFLATLMTLMLMYPLFKWLCLKSTRVVVFFVLTCLFYFVDFSMLMDYNYFNILSINKYLVYFFMGIAVFDLKLDKMLNHWIAIPILVIAYVVLFICEVPLLTSMVGIFAMCSLCMLLARWVPNLFSSFRDNIYQVYLLSMIFQAFVELILWKKLFYNEHLFLLFYLINVLSGIYGPMLVTKVIKRCPYRWVCMCFGLKSDARSKEDSHPAIS